MRILLLIVVLGTSCALGFALRAESQTGARKLFEQSEQNLESILLRLLKNEAGENAKGRALEIKAVSPPGLTAPPTQPSPTQQPPGGFKRKMEKDFSRMLEKVAAENDEAKILEKILEKRRSPPGVTALPPSTPPPNAPTDEEIDEFIEEFIKIFVEEISSILETEFESLIRQWLKDELGEKPSPPPTQPPPTQPPPA